MKILQTRRRFLTGVSLAGASGLAAGFLGASRVACAEPPPEITTVRIARPRALCIAPQYVAEALLRTEGFSDIQYVRTDSNSILSDALARGDVDFSLNFTASLVISIDAGDAITLLGGVHPGCFELFGNERIRSITDLKGKTVGIQNLGSSPHVFLSVMAAYVGLDPAKDINWVTSPDVRPMDLFADHKIDAFLGFPPEPQEVRARNLPGHVIVNSALDHPWSQYFCCQLEGHRAFVEQNPIATKRVLRAILKAADLCVAEPERIARQLVDGGFSGQYDYTLQALKEVPYRKWRDYDPEDTIRFYALRLHELGMIKSSPEEIIASGTDWRFLSEIKRELKG
jgi:NitT/TauT family transport system substrate-binding protein